MMDKKIGSIFLGMLVLINPAFSAEQAQTQQAHQDHRTFVEMPEQSRQLMREDMLIHMSALNTIMGLLAEEDFDAAAEVAENQMGKSAMGKHRATGMGPGRYMPLEMRKLGWSMHEAASEFAIIVKKGDMKKSHEALQKVTSTCMACHYTYRTR